MIFTIAPPPASAMMGAAACAARGVMRCGQAVVKDAPGAYSPDLKLGEQ